MTVEQLSIYNVMEQVSSTQPFTGKKYETARPKPAKLTQEEKIFNYMRRFGWITPMDALREFGCMRLGARIYDLEQKGIRIEHGREMIVNSEGEHVSFGKYRLMDGTGT